jgi:cytochrome c biogenesis protein CcmG/thiol:disulfide interchange protein DsbE
VYGVPETFVIDRQGNIRLKLTGPVTPDIIKHTLLPLLRELDHA